MPIQGELDPNSRALLDINVEHSDLSAQTGHSLRCLVDTGFHADLFILKPELVKGLPIRMNYHLMRLHTANGHVYCRTARGYITWLNERRKATFLIPHLSLWQRVARWLSQTEDNQAQDMQALLGCGLLSGCELSMRFYARHRSPTGIFTIARLRGTPGCKEI
jgi:predicted aspartyl protease